MKRSLNSFALWKIPQPSSRSRKTTRIPLSRNGTAANWTAYRFNLPWCTRGADAPRFQSEKARDCFVVATADRGRRDPRRIHLEPGFRTKRTTGIGAEDA